MHIYDIFHICQLNYCLAKGPFPKKDISLIIKSLPKVIAFYTVNLFPGTDQIFPHSFVEEENPICDCISVEWPEV